MEFKPYAQAIGFLVRDWNSLQEHFGSLFGTMLATEARLAGPIWYAIQNDRLQRTILVRAAEAKLKGTAHQARLSDIQWAVERANDLGNQRDDAVHSPVSLLLNGPLEFIVRNTGHPRAKTLAGKDLLAEIQCYSETAKKLNGYVGALDVHMKVVMHFSEEHWTPLPDRPQLSIARAKNKG